MKTYLLRPSLLLILLFFLVLQGCEEDEEMNAEIQTLDIELLSPTMALLKGNIVNRGKFNVMDYGLVYDFVPQVNILSSTKISFGDNPQVGVYTREIRGLNMSNSGSGGKLYARAYLKNEAGTTYGQTVTITLPSYSVKSVTPLRGKAGDRVTITGNFHKHDIKDVTVSFGGATAKVIEVTSSKIVVEVPVGITNSYQGTTAIPIVLRLENLTLHASSYFEVIPVIKDFYPKSGAIGTTFFISGENLPKYASYSSENFKVYMGGVEVNVLQSNYSTSGFHVVVPGNLPADLVSVYVQMNGTKTQLPGNFTVTPHTISSISPASGLPGHNFKIFGSNFVERPTYYNENISVEVGNMPVPLERVSANELTVRVPSGFPEGNYSVVVKSKLHAVEAPQQYRVFHPSITSFSPASGHIGQEVVINGTFLPDRLHTVEFGPAATAAISTSNSLRVQVPMGIDAGKVSVKVKYEDLLAVSEDEFTVMAPTITSFSPNTGTAGSVVTISGTGFRPDTPYLAIKFGTAEATILSVTETTIRAEIPSGVTGPLKIKLEQNGQTVISNDNFTVTN